MEYSLNPLDNSKLRQIIKGVQPSVVLSRGESLLQVIPQRKGSLVLESKQSESKDQKRQQLKLQLVQKVQSCLDFKLYSSRVEPEPLQWPQVSPRQQTQVKPMHELLMSLTFLRALIVLLEKHHEKRLERESVMYIQPLLKQVKLFSEHHEDSDLSLFAHFMQYETHKAGSTIQSYGQYYEQMYIILKGKVQVSYRNFKQRRTTTRVATRGLITSSDKITGDEEKEASSPTNKPKAKKKEDINLTQTRILIQAILSQRHLRRTTKSPGDVLARQSMMNMNLRPKQQIDLASPAQAKSSISSSPESKSPITPMNKFAHDKKSFEPPVVQQLSPIECEI